MTQSQIQNQTQNETYETIGGLSQEQIDEIRNQAINKAQTRRHELRQRGAWIVCISCENEHAMWVGMSKQLVGIDTSGNPIIKNLR